MFAFIALYVGLYLNLNNDFLCFDWLPLHWCSAKFRLSKIYKTILENFEIPTKFKTNLCGFDQSSAAWCEFVLDDLLVGLSGRKRLKGWGRQRFICGEPSLFCGFEHVLAVVGVCFPTLMLWYVTSSSLILCPCITSELDLFNKLAGAMLQLCFIVFHSHLLIATF